VVLLLVFPPVSVASANAANAPVVVYMFTNSGSSDFAMMGMYYVCLYVCLYVCMYVCIYCVGFVVVLIFNY
jgi:hypothetical protein